MRLKLYSLFLFALAGLMGNGMKAMAQVIPEPTAQWDFNNPDDLMKPVKGSLKMVPAKTGSRSITFTTLSDAGITSVDGPTEENKAIFLPKNSALKVERAEGAQPSTSYTLMMDVMVENATPFDGLFQTDQSNGSDGDLFINKNQVGVASLKNGNGYFGTIKNNTWTRIVLSYRDGKNVLYQDGDKLVAADPDVNDRFKILGFGFYLFCDEDGEEQPTYVANVAFWETPLTDAEVSALGGYKPVAKNFTISTYNDLMEFVNYVNEDKPANAVLTSDIALTGEWDSPIGTEAAPFMGTFDGQGHKITGFSGTGGGKFGLFGYISKATVKNLTVEGDLTVTGGSTASGLIGQAATSHIENVHSALNITVNEADVHHVGGVVGSAQYKNRIVGCTFSGTLTETAGNNDCFAGISGYMAEDTLLYCANYGTITYTVANGSVGGMTGYLNNNGGMIKGCLNMGTVSIADEGTTPTYGGAIVGWLRSHTAANMDSNCWLEGSAPHGCGGTEMKGASSFTADKLATGEVCFMLNGNQENIRWYQKLGTDETPVLDSTHGQVYLNGRKHCDGSAYADAAYSNTYSDIVQDNHEWVDGFCAFCDVFDNNYTLTPNAEGVYEIASANQLRRFGILVNEGQFQLNAVLTADIDFGPLLETYKTRGAQFSWSPIGNWGNTPNGSACYRGHFDGQGHSIRNFNVTSNQNFYGLFGVLSSDCVIENFSIDGTVNTSVQYTGGIAAYARDARVEFRNLRCNVNIMNTSVGGRQGGILGTVQTTQDVTLIEGCTYSGKLDANDNGGGGNYGGMVGYINSNINSIAEINNCLFDGAVVNSAATPGGATFGGMVGYVSGGIGLISNSLSIGQVSSLVWGQFYGAVKSNKSTLTNCYYKGEMVNGSASTVTLDAKQVSDDNLQSGEVCWRLNEGMFADPAWRQVINEDEYPVPGRKDGITGIVYEFDSGNFQNLSDENLQDLIYDLSTKEQEFIENTIAYQGLLNVYATTVKSWEEISTMDEFMASYKVSLKQKKDILKSAENYLAYADACKEAMDYLTNENPEGEYADFLRTYLTGDGGPDADYPNGSYAYITENHQLNDKQLASEIAFVNVMLQNAIAGGSTPGTEITRLMTNADFAAGYEGWTVETDGGTASVGGTPEIMPVAEGYNNVAFNAYQMLERLPEGIYMMSANALFRTGGDIYTTFSAGQLYMNGTNNYVMTVGEDVISQDDAIPGENCMGESSDKLYDTGDVTGWVPQVREGCSVAFNAGRYQNFCVTEVKDGTLTVGFRNLGTGLGSDWLPFGNIHVYYLGTAAEANDRLSEVLEGFVARAEAIVALEPVFDINEIGKYPNIPGALKGELEQAIAAAASAATGEDKMKVIDTLSELFNQVHTARMAYTEMFKAAYNLQETLYALDERKLISDEDYNFWSDKADAAFGHCENADVNVNEALRIAQELNNNELMPKPVEGVYQLASAADLAIFSYIVNSGNLTADAVLTNDIDMAQLGEEINWTPIGNWQSTPNGNAGYKGHFNGQGHSITNFNVTSNMTWYGLFGVISDNAWIENFNIYGEITTTHQYTGSVAAFARDKNLLIRNIHSYVNIVNSCVGGRQGGILGGSMDGTVRIENCTYSGTLGASDNGGGGNYGGIVGYTNNSTNAVCTIMNCLFDGKLINTADVPGNCTFGGMVGYTNSSLVTIQNCLSIGTVNAPRYAQFFGALNGANSKIYNSYYKGDYINGSSSGQRANPQDATQVTDAQLASGEVCYKLNGDQTRINWFQTLGTDAYPVLEDSHLLVILNGNTYANEDPDAVNGVTPAEQPAVNGIYTLSGQKVTSQLKKGIYIVNGKKVLK